MKEAIHIAYLRYSPKAIDSDQSIVEQEQRIKAYVAMESHELAEIIKDPETSARKVPLFERKGGKHLKAMVDRYSDTKQVYVYARDLSRVSRDLVDGLEVIQYFDAHDAKLILVNEGGNVIDLTTAIGRLVLQMRLAVSEFEAAQTAERISNSHKLKQQGGKIVSRYIPYGFRTDPNKPGYMIEDTKQQSVIEDIKTERIKGKTLQQLADMLNEQGIDPPSGAKWHKSTISKIVKRNCE